MMPMPRILPLLLSATLIGSLPTAGRPMMAHAQEAGNDTAYVWTYHYKKGEMLRQRGRLEIAGDYKQEIDGKIEQMPVKVVIRRVERQEVKAVNSGGEATIQDTTEQYEVVYND